MRTLLLLTGVAVWTMAAVALALVVVKVLSRGRLRRILDSRRWYAHSNLVRTWIRGWYFQVIKRVFKISPNLIKAMRATTLEDMNVLRDAMAELDTLPTVRAGNAAIGIESVFELSASGYRHVKSPYTNHWQYPPFFIPGVPSRPFYDPKDFAFTNILEDNYPIIKDELMQLLAKDATGFQGYVSEGNMRLAGWNTFNFFFLGKKFEENCALCPKTTAILESLPRFEKDHIMFSALNPHARIAPHTGPMNGILRAHLGLVVPQGCYIRVGDQEHSWQEGKVMVFDDSFEHEVWNHSEQVRIVLFLNFWHPCFSEQEIKVLERYRTAYERGPVAQLHADIQAAKRTHDLATGQVVTKPAAA